VAPQAGPPASLSRLDISDGETDLRNGHEEPVGAGVNVSNLEPGKFGAPKRPRKTHEDQGPVALPAEPRSFRLCAFRRFSVPGKRVDHIFDVFGEERRGLLRCPIAFAADPPHHVLDGLRPRRAPKPPLVVGMLDRGHSLR
jgi:hypothetical protein